MDGRKRDILQFTFHRAVSGKSMKGKTEDFIQEDQLGNYYKSYVESDKASAGVRMTKSDIQELVQKRNRE